MWLSKKTIYGYKEEWRFKKKRKEIKLGHRSLKVLELRVRGEDFGCYSMYNERLLDDLFRQ